MNVYQVTITYNEPGEAELTVGGNSEDEIKENIVGYLSNVGFDNIVFKEIVLLGDAAHYILPENDGVIN